VESKLRLKKEKSAQEMFYELSCYTLTHRDRSFIHQHAVDAFAAQYADENTTPITLAFALIGLYLLIEKNFSGKEVQQAHMKLAKHLKQWPTFNLPGNRGELMVYDVVAAPVGSKRDEAILKWCASVWQAYIESHQKVTELVKTELWKTK
jgi:hypothetical protein